MKHWKLNFSGLTPTNELISSNGKLEIDFSY